MPNTLAAGGGHRCLSFAAIVSPSARQDLLDADKPRQTLAKPNFKLLALGCGWPLMPLACGQHGVAKEG